MINFVDNTVGCLIIKIYIKHRNPVIENNHNLMSVARSCQVS